MESWLDVLRAMSTCPADPAGERASAVCCDARMRPEFDLELHALGEEILDFMNTHFSRENTLMRRGNGIRGLRELFDLHAEDHGSMIAALVGAFAIPSPCEQKRTMEALLDVQLRRHLLTHDQLLEEQLPRL